MNWWSYVILIAVRLFFETPCTILEHGFYVSSRKGAKQCKNYRKNSRSDQKGSKGPPLIRHCLLVRNPGVWPIGLNNLAKAWILAISDSSCQSDTTAGLCIVAIVAIHRWKVRTESLTPLLPRDAMRSAACCRKMSACLSVRLLHASVETAKHK